MGGSPFGILPGVWVGSFQGVSVGPLAGLWWLQPKALMSAAQSSAALGPVEDVDSNP